MPKEIGKGSAITAVLSEAGKDAAVAYLGGDLPGGTTFSQLGSRGLSVVVREPIGEAAADVLLQSPEELLWFLKRWCCREEAR